MGNVKLDPCKRVCRRKKALTYFQEIEHSSPKLCCDICQVELTDPFFTSKKEEDLDNRQSWEWRLQKILLEK